MVKASIPEKALLRDPRRSFVNRRYGDGQESETAEGAGRVLDRAPRVDADRGHPFYERLNQLSIERGFDASVEGQWERSYSETMAQPTRAITATTCWWRWKRREYEPFRDRTVVSGAGKTRRKRRRRSTGIGGGFAESEAKTFCVGEGLPERSFASACETCGMLREYFARPGECSQSEC